MGGFVDIEDDRSLPGIEWREWTGRPPRGLEPMF